LVFLLNDFAKKKRLFMGGIGSGSWMRPGGKATVDSQNTINVRYLKEQGLLIAGRQGELTWNSRGEQVGAIGYETKKNGIQLTYNFRRNNEGEWQSIKQLVLFDYTPCHYGGQRVWLLCSECDRRVTAIHSAGKYFLCRHCYGLNYQSQHESYIDYQLHKAQELRVKLGGSASSASPLPAKPKGMHWKTYSKLQHEIIEGEMAFFGSLNAYLDKFQLGMNKKQNKTYS